MGECVPQMLYRIPIVPLCNMCWPRKLRPGREIENGASILAAWFAMLFTQNEVRQKQGAVEIEGDWLESGRSSARLVVVRGSWDDTRAMQCHCCRCCV